MKLGRGEGPLLEKGPLAPPHPPKTFTNGSGNGCGFATVFFNASSPVIPLEPFILKK